MLSTEACKEFYFYNKKPFVSGNFMGRKTTLTIAEDGNETAGYFRDTGKWKFI